MKLTNQSILKAKKGPNRYDVADGACPGLYLEVRPSGGRSFVFRYRKPRKPSEDKKTPRKAAKIVLGPCNIYRQLKPGEEWLIGNELSLSAARVLAQRASDQVKRGIDPADARREKRNERGEYDAIESALVGPRIEDVFRDLLTHYPLKKGKRPVTASTVRQSALWLGLKQKNGELIESGGGVLRYWKGKRLEAIRRKDAIALLELVGAESGPVASNRTLTALKLFGKWAVKRELLEANPFAEIDPLFPEEPRKRVLNDRELVALWRVCQDAGYPYGSMLLLVMVTGQRIGEVRDAPWTEFNLAQRDWTLPAGRMEDGYQKQRTKNSREHFVPLNELAMALLEALPTKDKAPFLFMAPNKSAPIAKQSKRQLEIYQAFWAELGEEPPKSRADPRHFTPHDLRRTCFTRLQKLGVLSEIADRVTNNSPQGMGKVYGLHDFANEKREALQKWGAYLEGLLRLALPKPLPPLPPPQRVFVEEEEEPIAAR